MSPIFGQQMPVLADSEPSRRDTVMKLLNPLRMEERLK
jgi:hypothetical protein